MQETQEKQVQFLCREDPLEEEMATHSSILACGNPMDRGAWRAIVYRVAKSQTVAFTTSFYYKLINVSKCFPSSVSCFS